MLLGLACPDFGEARRPVGPEGRSRAVSLGLACPDFGGLLWIAGCSCGCGYGYGYGCACGCACACACGYGCGCLGFVDVAGGVEIPEVLSVSMLDQV